MASRFSYYRIDRTFFLDATGTLAGESFVTSSKETLVEAFPAAIHSGEFPDDNLIRAWTASVETGKNHLSDLWLSDLHIEDGKEKVRTMKLIPDLTVRRGRNEMQVVVVPGVNDMFTFDVQGTGHDGAPTSGSYASIAALGNDTKLLASLGNDGPVEVVLDHTRLLERIPAITGPALSSPLPFRPFHDIEEFREFVEEQLPDELAALIPSGRDWDGDVPLETWFPASSLLEACDDAGCGNFDFW